MYKIIFLFVFLITWIFIIYRFITISFCQLNPCHSRGYTGWTLESMIDKNHWSFSCLEGGEWGHDQEDEAIRLCGQPAGLVRGQQDHLGHHPGGPGRYRGDGHCDRCLHPSESEEDPEDEVSVGVGWWWVLVVPRLTTSYLTPTSSVIPRALISPISPTIQLTADTTSGIDRHWTDDTISKENIEKYFYWPNFKQLFKKYFLFSPNSRKSRTVSKRRLYDSSSDGSHSDDNKYLHRIWRSYGEIEREWGREHSQT